jgi:pSer/pThr/pTyr-binding forkhead associated (FHA) protein
MNDKRASRAAAAQGFWAFRFISGRYQGSEFPLESGKEFVVGRASNTDMVLMEDMVSRKHAKIAVTGDEILIQDLGSTNGTFVNGEKVKQAKLKDGDRVLIGTSILKLVRQEAPGVPTMRAQEPARSSQEAVSTLRPRSLQGDISEQGLPSLVQLLVTSKQSGVLTIQGPRTGRLFFREGHLLQSTVDGAGPLSGKKALYRIFTWAQGGFMLESLPGEVQREFDEPTEMIVADALKQSEEARRARERLPTGVMRFELTRPLKAPLKDLSPKRLDTLQLVINVGELESILDKNPVSDVDTYRHLLFLLQKEYIQGAVR